MKKARSRIKNMKKKNAGKRVIAIVKRKGHTESYDERKVYGSCYYACRNAHLSEKESEKIADKVSKKVTAAMKKRKKVTSDAIFAAIIGELDKHNEDAAFLYETHRDIS